MLRLQSFIAKEKKAQKTNFSEREYGGKKTEDETIFPFSLKNNLNNGKNGI